MDALPTSSMIGRETMHRLPRLEDVANLLHLTVLDRQGFLYTPRQARTPQAPWVWYAPTFLHGDLHLPDESHSWLFSGLLARGIAVGGLDVGESYGSPPGRDLFTRFHSLLVDDFGLGPRPALLAQSRGALMHYAWASDHPDLVHSIGCIYPVCDLRSYPGIPEAAAAYGSSPHELEAQLERHNPISRLAPLALAGVPILHVHGDNDEIVPIETNTSELAERYRLLGGDVTVIVVPGLGHEYPPCPPFFESAELLDFLASACSSTTLSESRSPDMR
jgi:pimeloyl-ACP methyl ester carboxylesterase